VKTLLRSRLDAVLAEQDERSRKRQADTAAAKAALAAKAAERAAVLNGSGVRRAG
jgi:hypothetical protein